MDQPKPKDISVPLSLWGQIKTVLEARQFIADDDGDEDNDYLVQEVLEAMQEHEKEQQNG